MMNESKDPPIIVGIDIGSTKTVVIAAQKDSIGSLAILGWGVTRSNGVNHGIVMNIEQSMDSIQVAVEKCKLSNPQLSISEVYVGIAGQHIKSFQTSSYFIRKAADTEICKGEINQLIREQYRVSVPSGDQIIDIVPKEFFVDDISNILDPKGRYGSKMGADFHIVTADRNAIRSINRCIDKAGLIMRDIVVQPLASAAAVMDDSDLEMGVAVVDIGGGTTDIAVFSEGILRHTAVIPFGGVNITNDIRNGLGVLRAQAEQMKVQFGTALVEEANSNAYITIPGLRGLPPKEISVKMLAHIIQARMQEILDYVVYHLRQTGLYNKLYGGIILTGGGSQLKHLVQLTEYVTGLSARIGYPLESLSGEYSKELMNPMYATCIGLTLRGCYDFENDRYPSVVGSCIKEGKDINVMPASSDLKVAADKKKYLRRLLDQFKGKFMNIFME